MNTRLLQSRPDPDSAPMASIATARARFPSLAAEIVRHLDRPSLLAQLGAALAQLIPYRNFIVYSYREQCAAELLHTNLEFTKFTADMVVYIQGLYVLDPFYISATAGWRRGFLCLDDVVPSEFPQTEYYRMFYKALNIVDEARFAIEVNGDELVHVSIERKVPEPQYDSVELQFLKEIETFIETVIEKHWEWRRMSASVQSAGRTPLGFGVRKIIRNLENRALTTRETDIVELSIKGHSAKSIAQLLAISEGTVINHKRHVYEKLGISSQSQLFHLLLKALYGAARTGPATRPE